MAQTVTRVNLSAQSFPFLSELSGRAVIVKQTDQNYIAATVSKEDLDKDIGVASCYYCHNVIATAQGYQSISYAPLISAIPGITDFAGVFPVLDSSTGNRAFIGYTASGNFYYALDPFYIWTLVGAFPTAAGKTITSAFINGITYIYFENVGCYQFNFGTFALDSVVLTALVVAEIIGIVAVQGYLLAWSKSAIAWSSLVDPTDFTPSLITGAGGGAVQGARGDLVACVSHTIGIVIYTNQNAVAAPTSGNARYPFNFRELVASGGLASLELVTWDANSGNHYAYTSSGLQLISLQQVQTVIPEVTDFLAGAVFEDFNETTEEFEITNLTTTLKKRLSLISDRYLCFSYGITEYTHALIYDLALKRWGKLKYTHVDIFEFSLLQAELVETPRRSIAMLSANGIVKVVKIDSMDTTANGVTLLGKYQYVRNRLMTLEIVDVENVTVGGYFRCVDKYTLDGKNFLSKVAYQLESNGLYRKLAFAVAGVNHSLLFLGAYHISSLEITYHVHGNR
jgi:hypothetical protein